MAVVENRARHPLTAPGLSGRGHFEQMPRQQQRSLSKVHRRLRLRPEHRQRIARLECGPDAPADGLCPMREDGQHLHPDGGAHVAQMSAEALRFGISSYLRGWTDREIDQHVRGAGGCLLREHRGDELGRTVEIERALDANQHIVGRTQPRAPTPDEAAPFPFHNAPHGREIEVHRRQRFHRIGGTGGRSDRAGRGLGYEETRRR